MKMQKTLIGKIVSLKTEGTAVVEVTRKTAHPLYKKLMKRSKKYKVDTAGMNLELGQRVKVGSIKKMSKDKYFKVITVLK
ncbi:MAG: 30S ribosomal protein S17 [Candidatus Levybacteria bacterium RIFCSPLOWO2_01_FULL_36_13]|nr:MAG: 30S ribosomal protein S17 [Candidatus Levybacteria bacterium RIFCSPHIGHO2_01_FULL_36_15b]OGH35022.1 MAG: 30S ribosomal protein S17 [Candidatus Levybacteria bacterium RIFCSPLOWO2_01_FULL_36_13]